MEEKYYTPDEIARMFKVTRNAVYNWYRRGQLGGIHIGRTLRISEAALQAFIQQGRKPIIKEAELPNDQLMQLDEQTNEAKDGGDGSLS